MIIRTSLRFLKPLFFISLLMLLISQTENRPIFADLPPLQTDNFPVCTQPPLVTESTSFDGSEFEHQIYLPLILKAPTLPLPACTVYCGLLRENDPYRPAGYQTYFADEFDCNQLPD